MRFDELFIYLIPFLFKLTNSFVYQIGCQTRQQRRCRHSGNYNTSLNSNKLDVVSSMKGVDEFNDWYPGDPKTILSFPHALFNGGALRGIECKQLSESSIDHETLSIPAEYCLSVPYDDENWDVTLATKILKECGKGKLSSYYGYCQLLCSGEQIDGPLKNNVPPSTAPNAFRRWKNDEKAMFESSEKGRQLLTLSDRQLKSWKQKYLESDIKKEFTYEQFEWAMEAVHSRAFKGLSSAKAAATSIPLVATQFVAVLGGAYGLLQGNNSGDNIAIACALIATLPLVFNLFTEDRGDVAMLPYIDSINHKESANSKIEYDPLSKSFSLTIDNSCLEENVDGKMQLFISYGERSDAELLLNYGFLNNMESSFNEVYKQRIELAETYLGLDKNRS